MSNELIVITGPRGVGKTRLAATKVDPDQIHRVFVHDSENSMNDVIEDHEKLDISFGHYNNLQSRFNDLPPDDDLLSRINRGELPWVDDRGRSSLIRYYEYILNDLDENLKRGEFDCYIHDTAEKLEAGMAAWVESNKRTAGVKSTAYGRLWSDGVYPLYEQFLESIWSRGVKTIILVFHLKQPWENNRPVPGKVVPSGKKILWYKTRLYIWLVKEFANADDAPAGLVLKERMGEMTIVERPDGSKSWGQRRLLPRRIPHCTWEDIRRYLRTGCDLKNPAPGESISSDEWQMISELLTDEQMRLMIADAERDLLEARQQSVLVGGAGSFTVPVGSTSESSKSEQNDNQDGPSPFEAQVAELLSQGKDASEIAKAMGKPVPLVKAAMRKVVK